MLDVLLYVGGRYKMDKRIDELLDAYLEGRCTAEERQKLESHYLHYLDERRSIPSSQQVNDSYIHTHRHILNEIEHAEAKRSKSKSRGWYWAAAAVLVFTVGLSVWKLKESPEPVVDLTQHEIAPGGNRATLTFSDGSAMALEEGKEGIVMNQDIVYQDGSDVFKDDSDAHHKDRQVSLETPRGGTYRVTLSDGTKVWLNAASKLQYPQVFGQERSVILSGEAYFEVAHQDNKPFKVVADKQTIEVLGTKFNVRSYPREVDRTTLLEGKVKVRAEEFHVSKVLKPGQQMVWSKDGVHVVEVNAQDVTAWKEDILVFQQDDLRDILNDISRWYDVDVVVDRDLGHLPKLTGEIPRNISLNEFLKALKLHYNITFQLEGRRVTIR
ncbi:FecR family protein [Sphingobacterium yanglingense]|uniref:FecR family protein n=2 Tax=Sphingobacterium yanglingense TaxID=1437280 RepID=A0A4R6WTL9_9SPHI|nr:FecR family protein [Sphingobacterium yanglingense]